MKWHSYAPTILFCAECHKEIGGKVWVNEIGTFCSQHCMELAVCYPKERTSQITFGEAAPEQ
jgi:hypothetical protein